MTKQILVAYASGSGSTREVAEAIATVLRGADAAAVPVDVRPVSELASVAGYSAVVIGSSIRLGRWLPEAIAFLNEFGDALAGLPVALFTTCLTMIDDTHDSRRTVLAYMEPLLRIAPRLLPVGIGLFAGSLNPERRLVMAPGIGPQGDYRNWPAIQQWAGEIRPRLVAADLHTHHVPSDLSNVVLSYTDLARIDLHEVDLTNAALDHANLRRSNLSDATLNEANLAESDLCGANLHAAQMFWADLQGSDLRGADLAEANLIGADLQEANLSGCDLQNAVANGAQLRGAVLRGVNLANADLNWADLTDADLTAADLSSAHVGWANLTGATLTDATLTGVYYNDATRWPAGFEPDAAGCRRLGEVF
ncbi:MAG: pentapeptide repeat-containing protein [Caldilineaceae bacterium]|nr:pentapeptide repeat-containing protein [Caldilineaceae bacterium]